VLLLIAGASEPVERLLRSHGVTEGFQPSIELAVNAAHAAIGAPAT
jgi:hypothetical protein